jgi:Putative adhesin
MTEWDGETRREEFDTPEPIKLAVQNMAGAIEVVAGDTPTTTVEVRPIRGGHGRDMVENTEIRMSADNKHLVVTVPERRLTFGRFSRVAVVVRLPEDSAVALRSASSEVRGAGRLARFECRIASGDVDVEEVTGPVDIKAASGDIRLGRVGATQLRTASGRVRIAHTTGDCSVKIASGRVEIGLAEQSLEVRSASGDVTVDEVRSGQVLLKVTSGNIRVGVRAGVPARLDVSTTSGRARSELPVHDTAPAGGPGVELNVRTTSGNVLVTKAAAGAAA